MVPRLALAVACVIAFTAAACREPTESREQPAAVTQSGPATAPAPTRSAPPDRVTCDYPVKAGDTEASLKARFGNQARSETLGGAEGIEFPGLALWPDDPKRRVEVIFGEGEGAFVSAVRLWDDSEWRVAGLALGSTLAEVRAANGGPFDLWGFGWDYGGNVSDLKDGKLAALPGGCGLSLRLGPTDYERLPEGTSGEVTLSSDDAAIADTGVKVEELTVTFPE